MYKNIVTVILFAFPAWGLSWWGAGGMEGQRCRVAVYLGADLKVVKVTNTREYGSGSLSECVSLKIPRICVFEVSGEIRLHSDLNIINPNIVIAGQTAPSPGITITGAGIVIYASNVQIQHIRIRPGDIRPARGKHGTAISIRTRRKQSTHNVIIDHVSASWAWNKIIDTWEGQIYDVFITNSIISEGLHESIRPQGNAQSNGILVGFGHKNIVIAKNIFAHNNHRNPYLKGASSSLVLNNLIYDPCEYVVQLEDGENKGKIESSVVGNLVLPGPCTKNSIPLVQIKTDVRSASIYIADNWLAGKRYADLKEDERVENSAGINYIAKTPSKDLDVYNLIKGAKVYGWVLAHAGARPLDRDIVDKRIINSVLHRVGGRINCVAADGSKRCEKNAGGWPNLYSNYRRLVIPVVVSNRGVSASCNNLDKWLERYTREVEGGGR